MRCRNRQRKGESEQTKSESWVGIAGLPRPNRGHRPCHAPFMPSLPAATACWAEVQGDGQFFFCFVFKDDFIEWTGLFLRVV